MNINMIKTFLIDFKAGDFVKILGVNCGDRFKKRLSSLGIFNGSEVEIIKNDNFGPLIIKIFNSKIAFGRGQANKIYAKKI